MIQILRVQCTATTTWYSSTTRTILMMGSHFQDYTNVLEHTCEYIMLLRYILFICYDILKSTTSTLESGVLLIHLYTVHHLHATRVANPMVTPTFALH